MLPRADEPAESRQGVADQGDALTVSLTSLQALLRQLRRDYDVSSIEPQLTAVEVALNDLATELARLKKL